jgi:hypothetical protein
VFAIWCPRHGSRVLLFPASILSLQETADGVRIGYRCTCGHEGVTPPPAHRRAAA